MRKTILSLAFLSVFLFGACIALVASRQLVPPAGAGQGYPKWEYMCRQLHPGFEEHMDTMNEFGSEGWRMVQYAKVAGDFEYFCFERPLAD